MHPEGRKRRVSVPPPLDTSGFSSFQSSLLSASPAEPHSAAASPYCTPMSTPVGTPVGTPVMTPHAIATNVPMSFVNAPYNTMAKVLPFITAIG